MVSRRLTFSRLLSVAPPPVKRANGVLVVARGTTQYAQCQGGGRSFRYGHSLKALIGPQEGGIPRGLAVVIWLTGDSLWLLFQSRQTLGFSSKPECPVSRPGPGSAPVWHVPLLTATRLPSRRPSSRLVPISMICPVLRGVQIFACRN
ncbi:hypothetical protein E2C01_015184 [Portunus trituberculatus]|uniref:Uncharacterized protein n=1 Tax=Portunus trituberculatus TaxID=210409 RepID=A0A5B7DM13_PORTR|nr:hypothetical protein [Portunus trituberculatus]